MLSSHSTSPSSASSSDKETESPHKVVAHNTRYAERKKRLQVLKKRREEAQGGGKQQRKKTAQLKKRIIKRAQKACVLPESPVEEDTFDIVTKVEEPVQKPQSDSPRKLITYLNPNPQLNQNAKSEIVKKLEQEIDIKVECGALTEAQVLNERLIQQIKEEKLLKAMEARDFYIKQQKDEAKPSKRRQPKLKWTFVGKERWEAKGNM